MVPLGKRVAKSKLQKQDVEPSFFRSVIVVTVQGTAPVEGRQNKMRGCGKNMHLTSAHSGCVCFRVWRSNGLEALIFIPPPRVYEKTGTGVARLIFAGVHVPGVCQQCD